MNRFQYRVAGLLVLSLPAVSCSGSQPAVKPDDMSAAAHQEEAKREHERAREHAANYDPAAARARALAEPRPLADGAYLFPVSVYNPTEGHLREAEKHRAHARQHEAAAQTLQKFEEGECRDFPPSTRAACPLLSPTLAIQDIPGGVRVKLAPGARVDAIFAHMRCHYAYARARAFAESATCPLYLRGIEIKRASDPMSIDMTAPSASGEREVRLRSREEAVFVKGDRK